MNRRLDPEDAELFRKTVGDVKPVVHDRHVPKPRRAPPRARLSQEDRMAVLKESLEGDVAGLMMTAADEISYRRPGVPEAVLRKLRRGEYKVQGELDLHGMTVVEATLALREYLADALMVDTHCVRIVHGKGLRSGHRGPVLKSAVNSVLRRTGAVVAFVSARQTDGGTGAVYVLVSKTTA